MLINSVLSLTELQDILNKLKVLILQNAQHKSSSVLWQSANRRFSIKIYWYILINLTSCMNFRQSYERCMRGIMSLLWLQRYTNSHCIMLKSLHSMTYKYRPDLSDIHQLINDSWDCLKDSQHQVIFVLKTLCIIITVMLTFLLNTFLIWRLEHRV
jgi:hypothetical protein